MSVSKPISKNSPKELYSESRKKIRIILNLLGRVEPEKANPIPDEAAFATIQDLIQNIIKAANFEQDNDYKNAIAEIATWIGQVFQKEYLVENEKCYPNPVYAVKKGIELLHSFLHRDLRRKQFSFEEEEMFRNYRAMMNSLPIPQQQ